MSEKQIFEKWKQMRDLAEDIANLSRNNKDQSDYQTVMKIWTEILWTKWRNKDI